MSDLIKRLRTKCKMLHTCVEMRREAADEIERKDAEIERLQKQVAGNEGLDKLCDQYLADYERLRSELGRIAGWADPDFPADDMRGEADRNYFIYDSMRTIAREALEGSRE